MSYVDDQYQTAVQQRSELRRHDTLQPRRQQLEQLLALQSDEEFVEALAALKAEEVAALVQAYDESLEKKSGV